MANNSKTYKTKQKEEIIKYLKNLGNSHFNAMQIYNYFKNTETPIGMATIYRFLDKLVLDGHIKKYILDNNSSACYQFIQNKELKEDIYFHFKCNSCGDLIHFKCEELKRIYGHFLEKHQMNIDLLKTVYYGNCNKCLKNRGE